MLVSKINKTYTANMQTILNSIRAKQPRQIPDIDALPASALLSRKNLADLTGFTEHAFKKWAREGRGPRIVLVEGRPRTTVGDFKAWIAASARAA